jgi:hypothetical protein
MARETELIRIHTTNKYSDQSIDFGVFGNVDFLSDAQRRELKELLETLAKRIENNEYPFSK